MDVTSTVPNHLLDNVMKGNFDEFRQYLKAENISTLDLGDKLIQTPYFPLRNLREALKYTNVSQVVFDWNDVDINTSTKLKEAINIRLFAIPKPKIETNNVWHVIALLGDLGALKNGVHHHVLNPKNNFMRVKRFLALGGHLEALKEVIKEGLFEPSSKDTHGATIWHALAHAGHLEALKEAIKEGLFQPSKEKTNFGETVWHYLAYAGHLEALKQAIKEGLFNPSKEKTSRGETVWHCLAFGRHLEAIKVAIKEELFNPSEERTNHGWTVWHSLAYGGCLETLKQAIKEELFNPSEEKASRGETVWHCLAFGGHLRALKQAIKEELFNPSEERTKLGWSVWHTLAREGHFEELKQAIKEELFNPSEEKASGGETVWHFLANGGHLEALKEAIKEGLFNPSEEKANSGATVWHYLALRGHLEALKKAIKEALFNPSEVKDRYGMSVWHYLACGGYLASVKEAIIAGLCDAFEKTNKGENIWDILKQLDKPEVDELRIIYESILLVENQTVGELNSRLDSMKKHRLFTLSLISQKMNMIKGGNNLFVIDNLNSIAKPLIRALQMQDLTASMAVCLAKLGEFSTEYIYAKDKAFLINLIKLTSNQYAEFKKALYIHAISVHQLDENEKKELEKAMGEVLQSIDPSEQALFEPSQGYMPGYEMPAERVPEKTRSQSTAKLH